MVKCLILTGPNNTPVAFLKEYAIICLDDEDLFLNPDPYVLIVLLEFAVNSMGHQFPSLHPH